MKRDQHNKLHPLHPSCLPVVQHTLSITAEVSRQLKDGYLVDHYYWKEGKTEGHLDTVVMKTGHLTEQEGTLVDSYKTMYCLVNCHSLMKKDAHGKQLDFQGQVTRTRDSLHLIFVI